MKKIFALTLAAVMTASMATVAFAKDYSANLKMKEDDGYYVYVNIDGKDGIQKEEYFNSVSLNAGTDYDADQTKNGRIDTSPGGKTLYIPIVDATGVEITDSDEVDGWKVEGDWKIGKPAKKPYITSVKIDGKYTQVVAIELPEAESKAQDLVGTVTFYTTKFKDEYNKDSATTDNGRKLSLNISYGFKTEDFSDVVDFADAQIVDFDECDGEETLDFGEYMSFEVNLDGQSKLNLKNNTDFQAEVADLDKSANMDFINFVDTPSFNKVGTAYIYAADDTFLYEVVDGKLKAIDADYNEDYEAWEFKTRTLGNYVISDKEIDTKTVTEDKTDDSSKTEENTGKPNPDTGR